MSIPKPLHWTPHFKRLALGIAAVAAISSTSCSSDECSAGQAKCENGVAMECMNHEGLFGDYFEWGGDIDCGAPDLCILASPGSPQVPAGSPLCVLYPEPRPECVQIKGDPSARKSSVCASDGRALLTCSNGYLVGETNCASCTLTPSPDAYGCPGAFMFPCEADADCASGWVCHSDGTPGVCTRRCTCASSEASCADCREVPDSQSTVAGQEDRACHQGWCG